MCGRLYTQNPLSYFYLTKKHTLLNQLILKLRCIMPENRSKQVAQLDDMLLLLCFFVIRYGTVSHSGFFSLLQILFDETMLFLFPCKTYKNKLPSAVYLNFPSLCPFSYCLLKQTPILIYKPFKSAVWAFPLSLCQFILL